MKYFMSFLGVVIIVCAVIFCCDKSDDKQVQPEFLRIHVTANSASEDDQNLKYLVKDAVVEFMIPLLAEAESKEEAMKIVEQNLTKIQEVSSQVLTAQGAAYGAAANISRAQIPTRRYGDLVLESGIYDCLEISLGAAEGDNWWCVIFPAVCFVDTKNFDNLEYISKIWEIINSVTNQKEENSI